MNKKKYDVLDFMVVNRVTGEQLDIDALQMIGGDCWEKVVVQELAKMIGVTGGPGAKVLAHLLKNKCKNNIFNGTQREIAEVTQVSVPMVNKIIKALEAGLFLRRIRSGTYIFNPDTLYFGNAGNKHVILRIWDGGA